MVSNSVVVTQKLGEERLKSSGDQNGSSLQQQQLDTDREFIVSCLKPRGTRFLNQLLNDQAVLCFAKFTRLRNMNEGSIGTYIGSIYRACRMLNMTPTQIVAELNKLDTVSLQTWFDNLAENYLFKRPEPVRGSTMRTTHYALLKLLEANNTDSSILKNIRVRFQVKKRKPVPFTREEVKAVLKSVSNNPRNMLWIWLLCQSFARIGLVYSLTYGDFIEILESGREAALIWIDGEQKHTKERVSHDLPISPEVISALKARKREIESQDHKITKANASEYPIASYENRSTQKLTYSDFLIQVRRIVHRAGVQGLSYSTGSTVRYQKDVHTGFRGFCFSQWKGNTWLAHYFAGHNPPQDAFNYVHFETVDTKEKLAEYLRYRPRPFDEEDLVGEACTQLSSLGFQVDSKIRELLIRQLPDRERGSAKSDSLYSNRENDAGAEGREKCLRSNKDSEINHLWLNQGSQTPPSIPSFFVHQ